MAAWKCGWCGTHASMDPVSDGIVVSRSPRPYFGGKIAADVYSMVKCSNCLAGSIARGEGEINAEYTQAIQQHMTQYWHQNKPIDWHPVHVEGQDFKYAPNHIAKAASEAYKCHSIGAYMSAILMARTSIEAAAKDQGVTEGKLVQKINELANRGLIRDSIKDAAHHVRMFANDMAHGDIQVEVTGLDSEQVLRLLTFILQDIYEVSDVMSQVGISLDARKSEDES